MTELVQRLWERVLIGGIAWAVGVAVVLWALVVVGGGWGTFWAFLGLLVGGTGAAHALVGIVGLGVKFGREAAELD